MFWKQRETKIVSHFIFVDSQKDSVGLNDKMLQCLFVLVLNYMFDSCFSLLFSGIPCWKNHSLSTL